MTTTRTRLQRRLDARTQLIGEINSKVDLLVVQAYQDGYTKALKIAAGDANENATAFEDEECVIKALKAQMSPDAIEVISAALDGHLDREIPMSTETRRQLKWLEGQINEAVGF